MELGYFRRCLRIRKRMLPATALVTPIADAEFLDHGDLHHRLRYARTLLVMPPLGGANPRETLIRALAGESYARERGKGGD